MNIKAKGIANKSSNGDILDVSYPVIRFGDKNINNQIPNIENINKEIIELEWIEEDLNRPIENVQEAYLKLHLLSYKFVLPNSINLDGLFNCLPNVAWTNIGPIAIDDIDLKMQESKYGKNNIFIRSIDKFPCLTDYIIPKNVRIADTSRVRLGAYLSEGTTIMHEGFVNFNAGTLGKAMIEGRISAGVVIGNNSDLGGGSSTMGTLSGGNDVTISIGENCLLGANAGIGISLGNNCIVEAGLYITAGTKVELIDSAKQIQETKKALELSGNSDLLFLRDSLTGKVIAKKNKKSVNLNEELHNND
jgi:2,3,4,5-tetrahydropyridine-2-carboxylate N-succinyltransferase